MRNNPSLVPPDPRDRHWQTGIFILFSLFFFALPFLLGLDFNDEWSAAYRTFWYNFLGAGYKVPLETPKPLVMLLSACLPEGSNWFFAPLLAGLFAAVIWDFARLLGLPRRIAIAAVVLCTLGNNQFFSEFFLGGLSFSPILYLPLLFFQVNCYLRGQYKRAFILNFATSLIRPESWFCTGIFLLDRLRQRDFKPIYGLPLLAPLIWMFCDYRISGDWLLSFHFTSEYIKISSVPGTSSVEFWPTVLTQLGDEYGWVILLMGAVGLYLRARKPHAQNERVVIWCVLFVFLAYWGISFGKYFVVMTRFFAWSIFAMTVYALSLAGSFKRRGRAVVYLCLIMVSAALNLNFENIAIRLQVRKLTRQAVSEMRGFLANNMAIIQKAPQLMVPARRCGDFAMTVGPEVSKRFVYFREVAGGYKILDSGLALYVDYTARGLNFLSKPRDYDFSISERKYIFHPVYVTQNGLGIIYSYQRYQ